VLRDRHRFSIATAIAMGLAMAVSTLAMPGSGTVAAGAAPAAPAALTAPTAPVHDLIDYSSNAAGSGPWAAINTSIRPTTTELLRDQVSVDVAGVHHIYGIDASDHLIDLSAGGPDGSWLSFDVTAATSGPLISSSITVPEPYGNLVSVFGLGQGSTAGHLIEYSNELSTSGWAYRDISALLGAPPLVTGPTWSPDTVGNLDLFSTDSAGRVIYLSKSAAGWTMRDLTKAFSLPAVSGPVSATLSAGPRQVITVFGRSAAGHLLELAQSGSGATLWQATDVTTALGLGSLASAPTAATVLGRTAVAAVRTDGSLVLALSPTFSFSSTKAATSPNVSSAAGSGPFAPSPVAIAQTTSGILIAGISISSHLVAIVAPALWGGGFGAPQAKYISASLTPSALVLSSPSTMVLNGTIHIDVGTSVIPTRSDELASGAQLPVNTLLRSGTFWAGLRTGGYVAVSNGMTPLFSSGTSSAAPFALEMTTSGDLKAITRAGGVIWHTGTHSSLKPIAILRPDGALQVVADNGTVLWTSSTSIADRIIVMVDSKLGVTENPVGSGCNPFTAFFGRGSTSGCAAGMASEAWCSDFANWAWLEAGADVTGITAWSFNYVTYGETHGTFSPGVSTAPQIGDAVVWGSMSAAYGQHVGTVTGVYLGYIDVVSGNFNSSVEASNWINAATSRVNGYPIVGYIAPVAPPSGLVARSAEDLSPPPPVSQAEINTQDGGRL
jgi:hypothetical protein